MLGNVVVVLVVVEHKQGHIGDVHALVVVHHGFVVQLRVLQCGHDDMPQGACRVALGAPDDFATIDNRVALLVGGNAALAVDVVDLVDLALGKHLDLKLNGVALIILKGFGAGKGDNLLLLRTHEEFQTFVCSSHNVKTSIKRKSRPFQT